MKRLLLAATLLAATAATAVVSTAEAACVRTSTGTRVCGKASGGFRPRESTSTVIQQPGIDPLTMLMLSGGLGAGSAATGLGGIAQLLLLAPQLFNPAPVVVEETSRRRRRN